MAAQGPITISFPLDLGVRETSVLDDVQPVGEQAALAESINTRVGQVRGTATKSPRHSGLHTIEAVDPAGLVPAKGSTLLLHKGGNARVTTSGVTSPIRSTLSNVHQNAYYPYDLEDLGKVPGGVGYSSPATCTDGDGRTWFLGVRAHPTGSAVYATVIDSNGELLIAPSVVQDLTAAPSAQAWCGLTTHTNLFGSSFAVAWWWDGTSIVGRELGVFEPTQSLVLVGGGPITVYTPTSTTPATIAVHADPSSNADLYAFLVCRSASAANTVAITLIDVGVSGWSMTTVTEALPQSIVSVAVRHMYEQSVHMLAVACGQSSGSARYLSVNVGNMTVNWEIAGAAANHRVACGFQLDSTALYFVFAATHAQGTAGGIAAGTYVRHYDSSGNPVADPVVIPWKGLVSNCAMERPVDGGIFPLFAVQNVYNEVYGSDPLELDFLDDPAIELFRCGSPHTCSMVGRFAVDSALIYPAVSGGYTLSSSNNLDVIGNKIVLTYLEDTSLKSSVAPSGYSSRYVMMDASQRQVRYAVDADGLAMLPCAYWDGQEVAEWSPTHRTKVYAEANTGSGSGILAGAYILSAVVQWKDATGQLHRSFPAAPVTLTVGASEKPKVWVTLPASYKNGITQERFQVVLYWTEANGQNLYAQRYEPTSVSEHFAIFETITQPMAGATYPAIYTDGTAGFPLGAQCPPTFVDRVVIGDRAWGTDGRVLWYTKPKELGIAFEWSSEQTLQVPAAAGKIIALSELNSMPFVLCQNGGWVVSGQGPDGSLGGPLFNTPEQVSELGCTERNSVVKTPRGVMFVSGDRFALVGPGVSHVFHEIDASIVGAPTAILLREHDEVLFLSSTGTARHAVYNYEANRWTTWDSSTLGNATAAAYDSVSRKVLTFTGTSTFGSLDPSLASTTAQIKLSTGWIRLGGPEDDNAVHDIVLRCLYMGSHDLRVTLYVDYEATAYVYTVPAADLHPSGVDGRYYTVRIQPPTNSMRAIRMVIEERNASGSAMRPVSATIQFAKNPGVRRAAIPATAMS